MRRFSRRVVDDDEGLSTSSAAYATDLGNAILLIFSQGRHGDVDVSLGELIAGPLRVLGVGGLFDNEIHRLSLFSG